MNKSEQAYLDFYHKIKASVSLDEWEAIWNFIEKRLTQPAASAEPNTHFDDDAVDHFAAAMKDKLAQARAKGRHGWHECAPADLSAMLRAHVEKGDPLDVANFCMFLWSLGQPISAAPAAQEPTDSAVLLDALSGLVKALRERHYGRMPDEVQAAYDKAGAIVFSSPVAAPVAQEPVGEVRIENNYWSGGHFYHGHRKEAALFKSFYDLPVGTKLYAAPVAAQLHVTDEMVTRFLGWHLPQDFAPDAGISFNPSPDPHSWPVGTNLLTDPQARAMLEYVLQGAPAAARAAKGQP